LDYEIEIEIPEGYTVEELDALPSVYSNEFQAKTIILKKL